MKTYEIRKTVQAKNIVEAFNLDPVTPPEYVVMIEDDGEKEEETSFGFKNTKTCKEHTGSKDSSKKRKK
jgi:hypothetical protein